MINHVTTFNETLQGQPVHSPLLPQLNEYQLATLQRMLQFESGSVISKVENNTFTVQKTTAGILANQVGSGKSRCALALALSEHMPFRIDDTTFDTLQQSDQKVTALLGSVLDTSADPGSYGARVYSKETFKVRNNVNNRTLILVQDHLLPQWLSELTKLGIEYVTHDETSQRSKTTFDRYKYYTFGQVTLAPPIYVRNKVAYYARVIYDETDSFREHVKPSRITRDFTWLLTATIHGIPQKFPYDYLKYGYKEITLRASNDFVTAVAAFPPIRQIQYDVQRSQIRQLQNDAPLIMTMTARQYLEQLFLALQEDRNELMKKVNNPECSEQVISNAERQIKQADAKIQRIETQLAELSEQANTCPICWDQPPAQPVLTSCCDTIFCKFCILKCVGSCPFCRSRNVSVSEVSKENANEEGEQPNRIKRRDDVLLDIIVPEKKYLLVGDTGDVGRLRSILKSKAITSEYMAVKRQQMEDHRSGAFQVLIFDCNQFGKGLDMTYCDEIIVYADLQPAAMTQICGRLCRLGREREVVVHTFKEVI